MNKYVALSEFEEMLNRKKDAVEEEKDVIKEARLPQPSQRRSHPLVVASCCILVALVVGGAFLRVEVKIGVMQSVYEAAAKDVETLKARMATDNTKEQLATIKAHVDELQAAKMQLENELEQMKNIVEAVNNRANNIGGVGKHMVGGGRKTVARNRE